MIVSQPRVQTFEIEEKGKVEEEEKVEKKKEERRKKEKKKEKRRVRGGARKECYEFLS